MRFGRPNRRMLAKVRSLSWGDWRDLARAGATLCQVQVLVWLLPRGKLLDTPQEPESQARGPASELPGRIDQLARALARASKYGPLRPHCLVRAIALQRLIERAGYPGSRVRVGVRLGEAKFDAHAWVDYKGHVIGDDASHVGGFEEIAPLEFRNG